MCEARGDGGADPLGELDAVGHRHAFDRDERHDVDGAEARVRTLVLPQIDRPGRDLDQREDRRLDAGGVAGEGEDRAIVRGVG